MRARFICGFCGHRENEAILCPKCLERTNGGMKSRMAIPVKLAKWTSREKEFHHVQDDIMEFRSPDGTHITGRKQWREHLRRTDSMEMGHSDIKVAEQGWSKRKERFRERLNRPGAKEVEAPSGEIRPTEHKRIDIEMANRLHNRPLPDRKTLIKLTLDTMKDLNRRR